MKYLIDIINYDSDIEHILTIKVENVILEVFSMSIPFPIEYSKKYLVDMEFMVFGEYVVEQSDEVPTIKKIGNSLSYQIVGTLNNGKVYVNGLIFEDSIFDSDFRYLDQKNIKWDIDRIDISFL